ncbi:hypothetical protein CAMSH0001_1710 [Campylobacter showae RM3277]|uniref:Uncharacterized protein n=1 Tax=Campylobacter showae RM3277 TaxID=553219 RepID=C6REX6_9BACT|nr:hypothetical protein CAMSH0001_1710 [Campylobacter showae RM3277]
MNFASRLLKFAKLHAAFSASPSRPAKFKLKFCLFYSRKA